LLLVRTVVVVVVASQPPENDNRLETYDINRRGGKSKPLLVCFSRKHSAAAAAHSTGKSKGATSCANPFVLPSANTIVQTSTCLLYDQVVT
jgi:hypothetical protein